MIEELGQWVVQSIENAGRFSRFAAEFEILA